MIAVRAGHEELVAYLLENKARVESTNADGETALSIAQKYQRTAISASVVTVAMRSVFAFLLHRTIAYFFKFWHVIIVILHYALRDRAVFRVCCSTFWLMTLKTVIFFRDFPAVSP